jgi:hypothetical protein
VWLLLRPVANLLAHERLSAATERAGRIARGIDGRGRSDSDAGILAILRQRIAAHEAGRRVESLQERRRANGVG